jgi:hypothetical protein
MPRTEPAKSTVIHSHAAIHVETLNSICAPNRLVLEAVLVAHPLQRFSCIIFGGLVSDS